MAVTVHLSGHLKAHTNGVLEIRMLGEFRSVGELLEGLWQKHPALRDRVLNEQGEIRQHVNIFANGHDVKHRKGLATNLREGEVHIFNAVSGG